MGEITSRRAFDNGWAIPVGTGRATRSSSARTSTTTAPPIPGGPEQPTDPLTEFAESFPTQLQFTQTVLQDVEVLAVGPDTRNDATDTGRLGTGLEPQGSQVIVLEVTAEIAGIIGGRQIRLARRL